jgi:small subunit ribosomal protein S9
MSTFFGRELKSNTHRKVLDILNELNKLRYIAEFGERGDIADKVKARLDKYLRQDENSGWEVETKKVVTDIDSFGRTSGVGKRKEASAKVWIIPTKSASQILDVQSPSTPESESQTPAIPVPGEILVNHLPISKHFTRPLDREIILRPLRLAGLLGAYNVFAKVKGGGSSGQAGAVALGLSRALLAMRGEEVKDTLMAGEY